MHRTIMVTVTTFPADDQLSWTARFETLELRRERVDLDWSWVDATKIIIGGRDLRDWVVSAEREAVLQKSGAAGYLGLHPGEVDWTEHLLGRSPETDDDHRLEGRTLLLGCGCSDIGCWPLYANILVDDSSVFWYDFINPHLAARGESPYGSLGPFRFDRMSYERELTRFAAVV
jgi:hypothetical protein